MALHRQSVKRHRVGRRVRRSVAVASLIYVFVQCYALYLSTAHVFKHSSNMCPVCVAMKNYDHALVSQPAAIPLVKTCDNYIAPPAFTFHSSQQGCFRSRDPPNFS